jgi:hypothetical protein
LVPPKANEFDSMVRTAKLARNPKSVNPFFTPLGWPDPAPCQSAMAVVGATDFA